MPVFDEAEATVLDNGQADVLQTISRKREALAACPEGHPDRGRRASELGEVLCEGYQQMRDIPLITEGIEAAREALALHPPNHPYRAFSCSNLAFSLLCYYHQTGNTALLNEASELQREALALRPPGHAKRGVSCQDLGSSLRSRYQQCGDILLLDQAIELEREVLTLRPPGHPGRAISCGNLASSLNERYEQCGDLSVLQEAIELDRDALTLLSPGHPLRAVCCANLGALLQACYERCGDLTLLDESIELHRQALALLSADHPLRAGGCANLGASLYKHYQQGGDLTLLDEAIEVNREALAILSPDHPLRAVMYANLGPMLQTRYRRCGDVTLLDQAIQVERDALTLRPPGHPERSGSCTNLGSSLRTRYEQCGDLALLDEAIELMREALILRRPGHAGRAKSCANLGSALQQRYGQCGDITLLDQAIEVEREALALRSLGHSERAVSCNNLGISLHTRYKQCGSLALLDEVIELQREALALQPPGHPAHSLYSRNLALSLKDCYNQTKDVALLDEVITLCGCAMENDTSLMAFRSFEILSHLHLIPDTPHFSTVRALYYLDLSFQTNFDNIRDFIYGTSHTLSQLWRFSGLWTSDLLLLLCNVYAKIIDRLMLAAGFVLDTASQLKILKATSHLGMDACVVAMLAEQPSRAIELFDRSHSIVWTQALHQRNPQMEGAPPELGSELRRLLVKMANPVTANLRQDARHEDNTRIQVILREIRTKPGLEWFMLGSTYDVLREAARNHPVVVLVAARSYAFALIMPSSSSASPDVLPLNITWDDLRSLAVTTSKANLRYRAGSSEHCVDAADQARAMRDGNFGSDWSPLAGLWIKVVKPVLTHLRLMKEEDSRRRSRLHWCIITGFTSVPVHAAGIYTGTNQECCSDYVVSSYTPTLTTLLRARKGLQPIPTADTKLLLVAAEHTADARLPALGKVKAETQDICSVVEKAGVQYAASSQSVSKTAQATVALPAANLVHIACHGLQDPEQPLNSAFHLGDDDILSVSQLMGIDLKGAFLAFLSACETAKGDRDQPDQAIHLAATMLFVGFKSVVATMWAMRDEDGPIVSKAFYEKLLEGDTITADAVPYALDHAVRKLRESGAPVASWATFIHVGA